MSQLQISRSDAVIFPAPGFLGSPERPRCSTDHYTEMQECNAGIMPLHKEFLYWSRIWPLPRLNLSRHLRILVSVTEDCCRWEEDHFWFMWKARIGKATILMSQTLPQVLFQPFHWLCLKSKAAALLLHCHYRQVSHMAGPLTESIYF